MTSSAERAVLVTGASSGIGNATARYLAERGCCVYGTVRNEEAAARLREIPNVVPLLLDVTKPDQIHEAVESVTGAGRGLYGLVNNAGLGELGMLSGEADSLRVAWVATSPVRQLLCGRGIGQLGSCCATPSSMWL